MTKQLFITGIDTGVGKTYATGLIAKGLLIRGFKTITMKPIQTGNDNFSEDILEHRKLMGINLTSFDKENITSPYIFKYPASPHLAAKLENKEIDIKIIIKNIEILENFFEYILIEGAGGLMVPINENFLVVDLIKQLNLETIIVSSSKLGSINHTLLSIEAILKRGIKLKGIIYNEFPNANNIIKENNLEVIKHFYPKIPIYRMKKEIEQKIFDDLTPENKTYIPI